MSDRRPIQPKDFVELGPYLDYAFEFYDDDNHHVYSMRVPPITVSDDRLEWDLPIPYGSPEIRGLKQRRFDTGEYIEWWEFGRILMIGGDSAHLCFQWNVDGTIHKSLVSKGWQRDE